MDPQDAFDQVSKTVRNTDADGMATAVDYNAGETVADVLLEVEAVRVTEIVGGKRTVVVPSADLLVLSMMPTQEELDLATAQLGLPPGTITTDADATGKPFVFIMVGNYKLPIGPFIPILQFDKYTFNFVVGTSFIEIYFPPATPMVDVDAFPFILGTYGKVRVHPKFQQESAAQTQRTQRSLEAVAMAPTSPPTSNTTYGVGGSVQSCEGGEGQLQTYDYGSNTTNNVYGATSSSGALVTTSARAPSKPISTRIAGGITGAGRIAAVALAKGSRLLASGLYAGTDLIIGRTRPCQQALKVPPKIKSRLEMTRKLTKGAAVVSGTMATSAISVAAVVGNVIGSNASEMLAGDTSREEANPTGRALMEVGCALFSTGALVFSSLLDAKTQIFTATGENITKMVTHKLGAEAGGVSGNVVGIALDATAATAAASGGIKKKIALAAAHTAVAHHQQTTAAQQQQAQLQYHAEPQRY